MANGHDQLFKELLDAFTSDYIRLVWPEMVDKVDLEHIEAEPTEGYLDTRASRGQPRRPDLVAKLYPPDDETIVAAVLHIEIETKYRANLGVRLAEYNRLLRHRHNRPVMSSALVLRGGKPGITHRSVRERALGVDVTRFDYRLFGLRRASAVEWLARPEPLAWALAALMQTDQSRVEHRIACLTRIWDASRHIDPREQFLLGHCVIQYLPLDEHEKTEYERILDQRRYREVRNMEMTWSEELIANGKAAGLEQGLRQGVEQGMRQGVEQGLEQGLRQGLEQGMRDGRREERRRIALSLLEHRFGSQPATIRRKVETLDTTRLDDLVHRLVDVSSLDELDLD